MMTNNMTITNVLNSKITKRILVLLPLLTLIISILCGIQYQIWDDDYMNWIAKGLFASKPDEHLLFINVCLGYVFKFLYSVCNSINWYGLSFILIGLASTYTLLFVLKKYINYYYSLLISLILELFVLFNFTFTCLAIITSAIALIKMIDLCNDEKLNRKSFCIQLFATIILYECGFLLRKESGLSTILILIPLIIITIWKNIKKKRLWLIILTVIVLSSSFTLINNWAYSSKEWKDWENYNIARAQVLDYPITNYEKNKNAYKKIGISENDYKCMYFGDAQAYLFSDKQYFNEKRLKQIVDLMPKSERYNYNVLSHFKQIIVIKIFIVLLLLCALFFVSTKNRKKWFYVAHIVFTYCTLSYLAYINRLIEKVFWPLIMISMAVAIYQFASSKTKTKKYIKYLFIVCGLFMVVWTSKMIDTRMHNYQYNAKVSNDNKELISYIEKDKGNNLYILDLYQYAKLYYQKPILDIGNQSVNNVLPLLDCYSYSPYYYKHIERFNLKYKKRMNLNFAENDNVFFIDWGSDKVASQKKYIIAKYIEEHTQKKVRIKTVKHIKKCKANIYKIEYQQK